MDQYDTEARRVRMWGAAGKGERCECCGIKSCDTCWQTCEFNGACSLPADFVGDFMMRLTSGYELQIMHNGQRGEVGDVFPAGTWAVKLYRYGSPIHGMRGLVTLSPSTHVDAARSALHTLRCAMLISAEAVEA
jgi:hypothetical protein